MKSYLSDVQMLGAAFCITLSLTVFIFWEVTKMVINSINTRRLLRVLNAPPEEFDRRLAEQQKEEQKRMQVFSIAKKH